MNNSDLIAYLKPISSQFSQPDAVDLIDMTGRVTDIQANRQRLTIRMQLPEGLYRGRIETVPGAFDMNTAMIEMVRVPDGKRIPVGPWDLDHIHQVMAMPMARTYVNGKLKGGLWFAMPGPAEIAENRLFAEFGFEAVEGCNELTMEFTERDCSRLDWSKVSHLELRNDDRVPRSLPPRGGERPRIFLRKDDLPALQQRWKGSSQFEAIRTKLLSEDLVLLTDNSQGTLELACLFYAITGDTQVGARAKQRIMDLVHAPTWSGRPDPLLMGGDNDRGISLRLYMTALGWDYLHPLLNDDERGAILARAEEYIGKMYDFTLLQRGYMGCPAIDPHSLGAWNGTAIACMAFYHELAIARKALPLFHGLFCESLQLFPPSGKAAWATYFPFHLVLYLAAAHTFSGMRNELNESPFLDHLGEALLASFAVPNSQEMQRGLRTREHRFLTAYLCRFHPTPGIDTAYRAFVEQERLAAGDVVLGIFDLLYAPSDAGPVASFPDRPLLAKDVGDLIASVRGEHTLAVSISGGPKAGRQAVFHLMPQNREFAPAAGALDLSVDGTPVLCNINMGQYGLNSALTNTMCFEDGGVITNGQYLNGAVPPDCTGVMRRCLVGDRYIYAHIVITHALDPKLQVRSADRVFVLDRKSGVVLLSDAFHGDRALRFATHLHCSGSVTQVDKATYRMTGGQANLIAGMKGGSKGLDDAERGECFVQILQQPDGAEVVVEEPTWVPGYIYGLNNTGTEQISDARFPRYQRWRLQAGGAAKQGAFLVAIGMQLSATSLRDGAIHLPSDGRVQFGPAEHELDGVRCICECLLWDEAARTLTAMGLRQIVHAGREVRFPVAVDLVYQAESGQGTVYSQGATAPTTAMGFELGKWVPVGEQGWRTIQTHRATLRYAGSSITNTEMEA